MRKNININLFGTNYAIDEDACRLLEEYLDEIKQYFARQEGGEEIADDIEHRVAELLWEKKEQGVEVIDQMTIKTILKQIGKPEQMADESAPKDTADDTANEPQEAVQEPSANEQTSANESSATPAAEPVKRKLYRDTSNSVLGGVISGLTLYFGGSDPLLWRILFVVATLFLHILPAILIYVLLWVLIPEAKTDEQRRQMTGGADTAVANGTAGTNSSSDGCAKGCFVAAALVAVAIVAFLFFFSSIYSAIFGMLENHVTDPVGSGIFNMLGGFVQNLRLLVIVLIGAVLLALYFLLFRTGKNGKVVVLVILAFLVAVFALSRCAGPFAGNFMNWNRSVTHTVTNGNTIQRITHSETHDWNGTTIRNDTVVTTCPDDEVMLEDCE